MAFATAPALPTVRATRQHAASSTPRMATISYGPRRARIHVAPDDVAPAPPVSPEVPEVTAVAGTVCEFMNNEHLRDLATYVVRFGKNFDDLSQLTNERLDWPLGLCHSANDIISALKYLSSACGLPADF